MKLFVDDIRDPMDWVGPGWVWAKNYYQAIDYLQMGDVDEISLDHDLGDIESADPFHREMTGYDIALWMAEHNVWPPNGVHVHSANPGQERIRAVIDRYGPY